MGLEHACGSSRGGRRSPQDARRSERSAIGAHSTRSSVSTRPLAALLLLPMLSPGILAQGEILVSSRFTDQVLRYDLASGAFLGVFASGGGLVNPVGLTFGPDGNLYVASGETDRVLRYDGGSGAFLGVFAQGGGLDAPRQVNFGPDGNLYVASGATNRILRYDGASGAFLGVFASGGNLSGPTSFTFGPDGDLFVGSVNTNRVKRFDGTTGAFLGNFVAQTNGPHDVAFGPDGLFYVSNAFDIRVRRYDGITGALVDVFVTDPALSAPLGLAWDELGRLYVANQGGNEVRRYDGETGAYIDSPVAPGSGGLSGPLFAIFRPSPALAIHAPVPGIAGATSWLAASGATPGASLLLAAGRTRALRVLPGCSPLIGLPRPDLLVPCIADESGRALFRWNAQAGLSSARFFLRAAEPSSCRASALIPFRFL